MKKGRPSTLMRVAPLLALIACLALWQPGKAAADTSINISGDYDISFNWADGQSFTNKKGGDNFETLQRIRIFTTVRVSERLQLFSLLRILPNRWGHSSPDHIGAGYGLDADSVSLRSRHLYLDWQPIDDLRIRMGMIPVALPYAAFRNGVLDTTAGGVHASYAITDWLNIEGFWARPYDNYDQYESSNKMDFIYAALPMNFTAQKVQFHPWFLYSLIGKNSSYWNDRIPAVTFGGPRTTVDDNGRAWWAGFSGKFSPDNWVFKTDFAYGSLKSEEGGFNYNASGWYAALAVDYKTEWGIPGVFGWYASGSDADDAYDDNKWGTMPTISTFGDGFAPTSFGFKAGQSVNRDGTVSWVPSGKWGVGLQVTDISFIEKLKHTIRVAYYSGTNDKELAGDKRALANTRRDFVLMTKGDHAIEVNFNHEYKIYENLILGVDMGYINMERCKEWGSEQKIDDAWAVSVGFKYKF